MKHLAILAALIAVTPAAMAEDYHQHDAHEHGVGALNIAMSGNQLAMELTAPGADIVGFEYIATTAEDKHAIEHALEQLHAPLALIVPAADAQCRLLTADAHLDGEEHEEEHHDHEEEHDHETGDQHAEFHAEYLFECANPAALNDFSFPYFQIFPNALELEVQIVNDSGARAFEVERAEPQLDLQ